MMSSDRIDGRWWSTGFWSKVITAVGVFTLTIAVLPAGATAISFGFNLFGNGTLTTDDYAMYDTIGAPAL